MLDFLKNDGIINLVHDFGELCNGSTTDSDSVCWGSNPYSPAIDPHSSEWGSLFFTSCRLTPAFK